MGKMPVSITTPIDTMIGFSEKPDKKTRELFTENVIRQDQQEDGLKVISGGFE